MPQIQESGNKDVLILIYGLNSGDQRIEATVQDN